MMIAARCTQMLAIMCILGKGMMYAGYTREHNCAISDWQLALLA